MHWIDWYQGNPNGALYWYYLVIDPFNRCLYAGLMKILRTRLPKPDQSSESLRQNSQLRFGYSQAEAQVGPIAKTLNEGAIRVLLDIERIGVASPR